MTINLFAIATRQQFRFPINGQLSLEEVWTLPLKPRANRQEPSLNELAQILQDRVDALPKRNFVDDEDNTRDKDHSQQKLDLVLEIIAVKKAELKASETAVVNASRLREIDAQIAVKKQQKLAETPLEDLEQQRAALLAASGQ